MFLSQIAVLLSEQYNLSFLLPGILMAGSTTCFHKRVQLLVFHIPVIIYFIQ